MDVTPRDTWSCIAWRVRHGLLIRPVSIAQSCQTTPEILRCCSQSYALSSSIIPAVLEIVCTVMNLVVVLRAIGSATRSTGELWRNFWVLAAHPGEVGIQSACQFLHSLLHGAGGAFIG